MNFKNINLLGLNTYASHRVTEKNYLLDCNNIVADQMGVIGTRRGQEFFGDALVDITKILSAIGYVYVFANNKFYVKDVLGFRDVAGGTYYAYNSQRINYDIQNKSLFFNGIRSSTGRGTPLDYGIKKVIPPGAANSITNAGLEAPINVRLSVNTSSSNFADGDSVRVRVFYQYTDPNGYLIVSPVSESAVGTNDFGAPAGFTLNFQIPIQFNNYRVSIYYAISYTVNGITPDDNLFWGEETLIASGNQLIFQEQSMYTYSGIIDRNSIINPVDLYTNASQEGILQNNDPPLAAIDIDTYSEYTFYSNLKGKQMTNGIIEDLPVGSEVISLNTYNYERVSSNPVLSWPLVEFSGADIVEAAYNLAMAITATSNTVNARIIPDSFDNFGVDIGWVDGATAPEDTPYAVVAADNNNNIYYSTYPGSTGAGFYKYNTISNVWTKLADLPDTVNGNALIFDPTNNRILSFMGLGSVTTNAPVYIYSINNNIWSTGTNHPGAPGLAGCAVATDGEKVYATLGSGGSLGTYVYNLISDTWESASYAPNIPTASSQGRASSAGVVVDNKFYVFGGQNTTTSAISVNAFVLDIPTLSWSTIADMPLARYTHGVTNVANKIYIVNGQDTPGNELASVAVYDIPSNTYSTIANTNTIAGGCGAVNIDGTIYRVGGADGAVPRNVESYRVGGIQILFEGHYINDDQIDWDNQLFVKYKDFNGSDSPYSSYDREATILFSKQGQPEAVPFFNSFNVGSASSPIVRIAALRSSLLIFKSDGVYQLNGISPETFGLQQLDPTCQIIAAQSLAKLDNEIYCLTSKGVACINESGARIISYPIKDLIDEQLYSVPEANWDTAITATAYDLDYKYVITIGNKTFTYNYITEQWTIWHAGNAGIKSWTVFENKIYYADTTRVLKERKSFTSADFQDENGNGIDASMQFNNLEFSPGKQLLVQDMQILQRNISNLTVGIQFENDFNTPASFDKTLDAYVSRVFPPNGSRQAFYFRPKFTWNTEIVATPGTFATSSFEGLDIGYEELKSNLR